MLQYFISMLKYVLSLDVYFSRSWTNQGQQHPDGRGFTGAILSQETVYIAVVHGKRKIPNGMKVTEFLTKLSDLNNGRHGNGVKESYKQIYPQEVV
jgi:hypothetical protein